MSLKVLISGGGIGGLCLAQGLRRAGIEAVVFERDASLDARGQGYRFRIDADGDAALRDCLPSNLYALYRATSNQPSSPPVGAYDHQLNLIYRLPVPPSGSDPASHQAVNRRTLRQVLLGGLEEVVHFDHALTSFTQDAGGVQVRLANGRTLEGDLLVAADGAQSAIRRQLLPHAAIMDTGMRCVYGRILLNDEILRGLPEPLFGGFTPVLGPERHTLAFGMFRPCRAPDKVAAELAPGVRLDPVPDYLMWLFVAPKLEIADSEPAALHHLVREATADWHPKLRRLLEIADVPATFLTAIRSAEPVPAWQTGRVTLLGDAIHTMTPAGGIGANTALRDAALLSQKLTAVASNRDAFIPAIADYESTMREYGFAAVRRSLVGAAPLYRIDANAQEVDK